MNYLILMKVEKKTLMLWSIMDFLKLDTENNNKKQKHNGY